MIKFIVDEQASINGGYLMHNASLGCEDMPKLDEQILVEPYRVCRRVNILRDYPDDKIKIYP